MSFPYGPTTFDALTTGGNVGNAAWGSDGKTGSGTAVVAVPGLFSSAKCALLTTTNQSVSYTVNVTGDTTWVGFDFQADAPPSGVTALIKCENAGGTVQASVRVTQKGIINFKALDANPTVGNTDTRFMGNPDGGGEDDPDPQPGLEYHLLYRLEHTEGRQTCWIWRPGYFIKVGGDDMVLGPDPITKIYVGTTVQTTWAVHLDNPFVTGADQAIPEQIEIVSQWNGAPTTDGVEIVVNGLGYSAVRGTVYDEGGSLTVVSTDEFDLPETLQRVKMSVGGLQPGAVYEYDLEGFRDSGWEAAGIRGKFRTLPERGRPWSGRIADISCLLNKTPDLLAETSSEYLLANPPDFTIHGGDQFYDNITDLSAGPFRDALRTQLEKHPVYAELLANTTMLHNGTSDHDWGGANDAVTQHPATEFGNKAWEDSTPHYDTWHSVTELDTNPENFTKSLSFDVGRIHFIWLDFRWLGRSASTDPDTAGKHAWHPDDKARAIEEIDDPGYAAVVLLSDPPWVGSAAEVAPKDDHIANYPNDRADVNDAIARRLDRGQAFMGRAYDYHGMCLREMGLSIDDTGGGAAWLTGGGFANNSGNIREDDWPNYEQIFAPEQSPDPELDIFCHGEMIFTDDAEIITIRGIGRDNDAGAVVIDTGVMSWAAPYTAPSAESPSYDLGDLPLTDPFGRWRPTARTEWPTVPAKAAAVTSYPFTHGQQTSNMFAEGGRVLIEVLVEDLDTSGLRGGRIQLDRNVATIKAGCAFAYRDQGVPGTILRFHQEASGPVVAEVNAVVLSSVGVNYYGTHAAFVTFAVELEREWTAPNPLVWELDLTDQDGFNERVTTLDGSFAPVTTAMHKINGVIKVAKIKDWMSQSWARLTVPDGYFVGEADEDKLPADKAIVVQGFRAWLVDDADGWDIDGGVNVTGWMDYTPGGLVLYPHPIGHDMEDRGVTVNVETGGKSGSPVYSVRAKKATY